MKKLIRIKPNVARVGDHRKVPNHNAVIISIDERLPKKFRQSVVFHERTEDRLQRKHGMTYNQAHRIATKKEKAKYFKTAPVSWKKYESLVSKLYNKNKRR
jgi:Asp-tRNA(Asn)/Glu-tRNA(Gln) amidotransferase B subunit